MLQLSARQIAAVIWRDKDRVIREENRVQGNSLTAAFQELANLGFDMKLPSANPEKPNTNIDDVSIQRYEGTLLEQYKGSLSLLTQPQALRLYVEEMKRSGLTFKEKEYPDIPETYEKSDEFFLGARHDGKDIDPDSAISRLIRCAFAMALTDKTNSQYRGPDVDREKLAFVRKYYSPKEIKPVR